MATAVWRPIDDYKRKRSHQALKHGTPHAVGGGVLGVNAIRSLMCRRQEGSLRDAGLVSV